MEKEYVDDLVYRLNKRAEIRRNITTRKSVQEGKEDRLCLLLEEAARCIEELHKEKRHKYTQVSICEGHICQAMIILATSAIIHFPRF